jgi:hypothetical protein
MEPRHANHPHPPLNLQTLAHPIFSRRQLLRIAALSCPLTVIPGCSSSQLSRKGRGLYVEDMGSTVMTIKNSGATVKTPIGENVTSFLEKRDAPRMTVHYSGSIVLAKTTNNADGWSTSIHLNNLKNGALKVATTFKRLNHGGREMITSSSTCSINGAAGAFHTLPILLHMTGMNLCQLDQSKGSVAWVYESGVGVPFYPASARSNGYSRSMRAIRTVAVPGWDGAVPTWKWQSKLRTNNFKGESRTTEYTTELSPELPGLIVSLSYRSTLAGKVVEQAQLNFAGVSFS